MTEEQAQKRLRKIALAVFIIGIVSIFIPVFPGWVKIIAPIVASIISGILIILSWINIQ